MSNTQEEILRNESVDMDAIIEQLNGNDPNLTSLKIKGYEFDPMEFKNLCDALPKSTVLEELSLVNCGLDDDSAGHIYDLLAHNPNLPLCSLNLSENNIGDLGATRIALAIISRKNTLSIEHLNLSDNEIGYKCSETLENAREFCNISMGNQQEEPPMSPSCCTM